MAAALVLTKEMERCLAATKRHGGVIKRYPGGFWLPAGADRSLCFKAKAVQALVKRELATYTDWKGRGNGDVRPAFPIEATLCEPRNPLVITSDMPNTPFYGLVGGMGGAKPIIEVMDKRP